jgi:hypothetical protein
MGQFHRADLAERLRKDWVPLDPAGQNPVVQNSVRWDRGQGAVVDIEDRQLVCPLDEEAL